MPVTINGDGSISGLAVGGLPNGTVDADTLASNSVTDAKIGTNAVTDAKISAVATSKLTGTIGVASFPSGSIIKSETFKGSNNNVSISANQDSVLEAFTFTTLKANSRLLIHYHSGQIRRESQNMNAWIWTSVDSTSKHGNMYHYIDHEHYFYGVDSSLSGDHRVFNVGFDLSNQLSAGSHTVRIGAHTYAGSAQFNYQGESGVGRRFTVLVMEMAQ